MVGERNQTYDRQDWLSKASPDELVNEGRAILSKIATMDQATQKRFVTEVQGNPQVARLFEQIHA